MYCENAIRLLEDAIEATLSCLNQGTICDGCDEKCDIEQLKKELKHLRGEK